jgi:hypothetical protein
MEIIGYYLLFAFSISLTACYLWFLPLVRLARQQGIANTFTRSPVLSTVVYVLVSALAAPFLVPPMFSEAMAARFCDGLKREVFKQDPEISA